MRKNGISALLVLALSVATPSLSAPALAKSRHAFETTISEITTPVKINVMLSDDMKYRATHLSKDIKDRAFGMGTLNDGWMGAGNYGQKDLDKLTARLKTRMGVQLEKYGVTVSDTATDTLTLVIIDARPDHPTFKQLSQSNLSMESTALGGAEFAGTYTHNGQTQGITSHGWYEMDISDARYSSTWGGANRAMDLFSRKFAKSVK